MQRRHILASVVLIIAGLLLAGCTQPAADASEKVKAAQIVAIEGTDFNRVILTEKAAQRLDVQTAPLGEEQVGGAQRKVVPYAALIYDLEGKTWLYTNPEPLTYVRQPCTVDYIEGDKAVLAEGPPVGTAIVTVGVPELYGADTGIGK